MRGSSITSILTFLGMVILTPIVVLGTGFFIPIFGATAVIVGAVALTPVLALLFIVDAIRKIKLSKR